MKIEKVKADEFEASLDEEEKVLENIRDSLKGALSYLLFHLHDVLMTSKLSLCAVRQDSGVP